MNITLYSLQYVHRRQTRSIIWNQHIILLSLFFIVILIQFFHTKKLHNKVRNCESAMVRDSFA